MRLSIYLALVVLVMIFVFEGLLQVQEATADIEAAQTASLMEGVSE